MKEKSVDSGSILDAFITKKYRKLIGGAILGLAILFATPPFIPTPDDFLNLFLANFFTTQFELPILTALALTYTLVPAVLFLLGAFVYPENEGVLLTKMVRLFRKNLRKGISVLKKKPQYALILLAVGWLWFNYYLTIL